MPFETASAASALKNATSAVSAIGIGREVVRVHVEVPFGCGVRASARPAGAGSAAATRPSDLDRLGEEREAVDGLALRVEDGHAGRDRERVAAISPAKSAAAPSERALARAVA